jgi:hypothetical protein
MKAMTVLMPAVYQRKYITGYFVDAATGDVYSNKKSSSRVPRIMPITGKKQPYLRVGMTTAAGEVIQALRHKLIMESVNLHLTTPDSVPQWIWDDSFPEAREVMAQGFLVNHIDHDKHNNHPSNLEWVTAKDNSVKAVAFHKNRKGTSMEDASSTCEQTKKVARAKASKKYYEKKKAERKARQSALKSSSLDHSSGTESVLVLNKKSKKVDDAEKCIFPHSHPKKALWG